MIVNITTEFEHQSCTRGKARVGGGGVGSLKSNIFGFLLALTDFISCQWKYKLFCFRIRLSIRLTNAW